jgi:hypothetical protein
MGDYEGYNEKLNKLEDRKKFIIDKKKKLDEELKKVDKRIKYYNDRIKQLEFDETIVLTKKAGLNISDIKKILKKGDIDKLKEMLAE